MKKNVHQLPILHRTGLPKMVSKTLVTVNLEIFARILFSQIALKDIFAMSEISD